MIGHDYKAEHINFSGIAEKGVITNKVYKKRLFSASIAPL
jgi:hypothetical protein